jgi:hypothetical protein
VNPITIFTCPWSFAFIDPSSFWLLGLILVAGILAALLPRLRFGTKPGAQERRPGSVPSDSSITQRFIAAIPRMRRELNLEVATSRQIEILELSDSKSFLGLPLGTNSARIQVPVTYRYHIRLHDPWQLIVQRQTLVVHAPEILCSLPPSIHTEGLQTSTRRGWARLSAGPLAQRLLAGLTSKLSERAQAPERLVLVREVARESVRQFVRRWMAADPQLESVTSIHVQFPDEQRLLHRPALRLLDEVF